VVQQHTHPYPNGAFQAKQCNTFSGNHIIKTAPVQPKKTDQLKQYVPPAVHKTRKFLEKNVDFRNSFLYHHHAFALKHHFIYLKTGGVTVGRKTILLIAVLLAALVIVTGCGGGGGNNAGSSAPGNNNKICIENYSSSNITPVASKHWDKVELNGTANDIDIDSGSSYCFENLADGNYTLHVVDWYYGSKVLDTTKEWSLSGGQTATLTIY
jgi:hypothetical protein